MPYIHEQKFTLKQQLVLKNQLRIFFFLNLLSPEFSLSGYDVELRVPLARVQPQPPSEENDSRKINNNNKLFYSFFITL